MHVATDGDDQTGDGSTEAPYATIQKAFDEAADFTRIVVEPGLYNECVRAGFPRVLDRPVTIIARAWIDDRDNTATTISGAGICDQSRLPDFRAPTIRIASRSSVLTGFTIRDGGASGVAAAGSVAITHNVITENFSTHGGGIYFYSGVSYFAGDVEAEIRDNDVIANRAEYGVPAPPLPISPRGGDGGGIYVKAESRAGNLPTSGNVAVTVDGNRIRDNVATEAAAAATAHGGGLVAFTQSRAGSSSAVAITNNLIADNAIAAGAAGYGGGAWLYTYGYGTESIAMRGNTVERNRSTVDGGGVSAWVTTFGTRGDDDPDTIDSLSDHEITLDDNVVRDNVSDGGGGGLDLFTFARNLKDSERASMIVRNNLVSQNGAAGTYGGGGALILMRSWRSSTPDTGVFVVGNTIRDNQADEVGGGISALLVADSDPPDGSDPRPPRSVAVSDVVVQQNLIEENRASGDDGAGGGLFTYLRAFDQGTSTLTVDRVTLRDNEASGENGGLRLEAFTGFDDPPGTTAVARVELWNSIVANNDDIGLGGPVPGTEEGVHAPDSGTGVLEIDVRFSDVWGHALAQYDPWIVDPTGTNGNLSVDPLLMSNGIPAECSPTIDAADPALAFDLELAPNGHRANMGHTGGTPSGTASLPDLDGSGVVDDADLGDVMTAFAAFDGEVRYDGEADVNSDGVVDGLDLAYMADRFLGACP